MSMHPAAGALLLAAVDPLFYLFLAGALPFLGLVVYLAIRPSPLDRREPMDGDSHSPPGEDP